MSTLAVAAADNGLQAPEPAAGTAREKSAGSIGVGQVLFEPERGTIKFSIRLLRGNTPVVEKSVVLPVISAETLAKALVGEIIAASGFRKHFACTLRPCIWPYLN